MRKHTYSHQKTAATTVLIGHGNGFPPEVYAPLAAALDAGHCVCLPARPWWGGENPQDFKSWHTLADDLIAGIEHFGLGPVRGVGHSMSGVAMVYASVKRPDLFASIVLLDPVYLPRSIVRWARVGSWFGLSFNRRLEQGALNRRREWQSAEAAFERFRKRSLFKRCSDEVLRLYVDGMTVPKPDGEGIELAYPPEWEARIFHTVPYDEWAYARKISVPCRIIGGEYTDVFFPQSHALWRKLRPDILLSVMPEVGHLLPLEAPSAVADQILEFWKTHEEVG